ncbi:hypothetical protein [Fructilactobacillus florum]|nr:hypothetical protein [Fructilactobacillus florum]
MNKLNANQVSLKNPQTGEVQICKLGVSWTVFFFGFFVPIFRKDWTWFLIMFISQVVAFYIFPPINLPVQIGFVFAYNNQYIKGKLNDGWIGTTERDVQILNLENLKK